MKKSNSNYIFKKDNYQKEMDRITEIIQDKYKPEKIILFGSLARGELREGSDIDMLIIKDSNKKKYARVLDVLNLIKDIDRRLPYAPIVLSRREFEQGLQEKGYFFRQILKDGQVLYEK